MSSSTGRLPVVALSAAAAAVLLLPPAAHAAAERLWSPLERGQVPAGEPHGAAPTSRGTIALAPEAKDLAAPPAPYLWSLARLHGTVYAGSGDGGEVWEVPDTGAAAKLHYDAPELQAQVLAIADGALVGGFNPGAKVARIGAKGADTLFKAPSEQYVWAILPDAGGTLHVAVGSPGRVYEVKPGQGTAPTVELDSGDGAVRSLARAKDGKLLAGTDGRGLVIRVDGAGKKFVLFDAPRREISSISVAPDGQIWFAAIGPEEAGASSSGGAAAAPTPAATPADPKKGPAGLLYRMRPDGFAEQVWTAPGPSISSVLARADGVYVATGDPGAVWRVSADGSSEKVFDPSAGQATALLDDGKAILVATANPSKVFRLDSARRNAASFEGSPLDAGGFAHWGSLTWEATGEPAAKSTVQVTTRSGNTATPDASWSAWSAPIAKHNGAIPSPAARYLQWRVELKASKGEAPELSDLGVIYRVENRAPKVDQVQILDPGATLAPKADALLPDYALPPDQPPLPIRRPLPAKPGWQRGWRAATWGASDPDGDPLLFDVAIRAVGDRTWIPIAHDIPENYATWDATALPDGRYELRVVAHDDATNGAGTAARGEKIEGPFESDTTPPAVDSLLARREGGKLEVSFRATDAGGVDTAWVSVDGGAFALLVPADGIADSDTERYDTRLPDPGPGPHLIVVRLQDRAQNQSSAKTPLR